MKSRDRHEGSGCLWLLRERYLRELGAAGRAATTIETRRRQLTPFLRWCGSHVDRGESVPNESEISEYPSWVLSGRGSTAQLARTTEVRMVGAVRLFYRWMLKQGILAVDATVRWELPRMPRRLPRAVLSVNEVERVLARASGTTPLAIRDRAIMEVLYSTGLRRAEALSLSLEDLQPDRQVLMVREGKGGKDRVVPIGLRALAWLARYLRDARPQLLKTPSSALFLTTRGTRIRPNRLTDKLREYVRSSGVEKPGSCHIFRHTMATLLHDGGADIRVIQEILGHSELSTTQIYTHISVERLRKVHARTHPAERGYSRRGSAK